MPRGREPNVRDVAGLLVRGLLPALAVAAVAGLLTYYVNLQRTPVYEAQATVVTTAQDPAQRAFGSTLVTAPALATSTYRSAVVSRAVLAEAWRQVEGVEPTEEQVARFGSSVAVRSEDANVSALLRISVQAANPAGARARADALARALVVWDEQRATRSLETIIESLEAQIGAIARELEVAEPALAPGLERTQAELVLQLSSARALRTGAVGRVELFELASTPTRPVRPRPLRDAVVAALLAVVLVYGLTLLRAAFDDRVRSVADLAELADAPVLAVFPTVRGGRGALSSEAASYLRAGVSFATGEAYPKTILVSAAREGEGKSSVAIALAKAFARQRQRTVLVDADLRSPVIAHQLGVTPRDATSLADVLMGMSGIRTAVVRVGPEGEDEDFLHVVPTFTPIIYPDELLASFSATVLDPLKQAFDVIVIDAPPILPVADALTIGPVADGVLLVVSLARADRGSITSAQGLLQRMQIPILGMVANHVRIDDAKQMAYGYGYGARTEGKRRA